MNKAKKMIKNLRIIVLLVFLVFAIVAIHPNPNSTGAAIRAIVPNSSAQIAGIESPQPTATPMSRERIISINNMPVDTVADYFKHTSDLKPNVSLHLKTNKDTYVLKTKPILHVEYLDEYEDVEVIKTRLINKTIDNNTEEIEENYTITESVQKINSTIIGTEDLGISVYEAPTSNIRRGLDLQGGSRVLLKPEEKISDDEVSIVLDNMKERLNVYGLTDVVVRRAGDLSGNQFFIVEIAGAAESEATDLVSKQGKFEAKIRNETVFSGGDDIKYVCRSSECAGIDPLRGCSQAGKNQWFCNFRFSIALSPEAAERQAELTKDLEIILEDGQEYLSEDLELYLDDSNVDKLKIGADLRGRAVTDISISGSGQGATEQDAIIDALDGMKRLQTILITGSLPVKLEIVKTDTISPILGEEFTRNAIIIGLAAIAAIAVVVFIRYRKLKIVIPMILTPICEVIILLGVASFGWDLDLAAIAGIIIVLGTGVDHTIIIADETLSGEVEHIYDWKKRFKRAFFIIMAAYFTTVFAMFPLFFAGAGLLRGFALTTIIGVSIGVFIVRPAFAAAVEILLKE